MEDPVTDTDWNEACARLGLDPARVPADEYEVHVLAALIALDRKVSQIEARMEGER